MAKASKRVASTHCNVNLVARELSGAADDCDKLAVVGKGLGWSAGEVKLATQAAKKLRRAAVVWNKATKPASVRASTT